MTEAVDDEVYAVPDHQEGATTNCFCSDCMEKRLADDRNNLYTPHDLVDAWKTGYRDGWSASRRNPTMQEPPWVGSPES